MIANNLSFDLKVEQLILNLRMSAVLKQQGTCLVRKKAQVESGQKASEGLGRRPQPSEPLMGWPHVSQGWHTKEWVAVCGRMWLASYPPTTQRAVGGLWGREEQGGCWCSPAHLAWAGNVLLLSKTSSCSRCIMPALGSSQPE